MTKKQIYWESIDLKKLYIDDDLNAYQIGKLLGVTNGSVYRQLKKLGIDRRNPGFRAKIDYKQFDNIDLNKLYWHDRLSIKEIAIKLGLRCGNVRLALTKRGIPLRNPKEGRALFDEQNPDYYIGENNPAFVGRYEDKGYIFIYKPEHKRARKTKGRYGYVQEHIVVWEETNNQELPDGWMVHHINGIKNDNRPKNLIALPDKKHTRLIPVLRKRIQELEALLKAQGQLI